MSPAPAHNRQLLRLTPAWLARGGAHLHTMKAKTSMEVPSDLKLTIELTLTVQEADALLQLTSEMYKWPMSSLREVLRRSVGAARASHEAEVEVNP